MRRLLFIFLLFAPPCLAQNVGWSDLGTPGNLNLYNNGGTDALYCNITPAGTLLSTQPVAANNVLAGDAAIIAVEACSGLISWSSAIADTARNRMVMWGGGHTAYYGNELYQFDVVGNTWKRLTNPAPPNVRKVGLGQSVTITSMTRDVASGRVTITTSAPHGWFGAEQRILYVVNAGTASFNVNGNVESTPTATTITYIAPGAETSCAGACLTNVQAKMTGDCASPDQQLDNGTPTPVSMHTYQAGMIYDGANAMYVIGGGPPCDAGTARTTQIWKLNLAAVTTACAPNCAPTAWSKQPALVSGTYNPSGFGTVGVFDPASGLIYLDDTSSGLLVYNPTASPITFAGLTVPANSISTLNANVLIHDRLTMVLDTRRRFLYLVGNTNSLGGGIWRVNLATFPIPGANITHYSPDAGSTGPVPASCANLVSTDSPGLVYDTNLDRVVGWPNFPNTDGTGSVFIYNPDTNTCNMLTFPGGPPATSHAGPPRTSIGTFGRFGFFPALNQYVLISQVNINVFALKISNSATVYEASGAAQTNRPVTIPRVFRQGEIPNCAQAAVNGTSVQTQVDVKNRWPDGSIKYAINSFLVPTLAAGGNVPVYFANNSAAGGCNNTGQLTEAQMLAAGFDFDSQINAVNGAINRTLSARTILSTVGTNCTTGVNCRLWLQGPIVTGVVLEDRTATRTFDMNTDNATGNPLHPIFEAWFYPSTNKVEVCPALENTWVSNTAANSVRDQIYNLTLKTGNAAPATRYTDTSLSGPAGTASAHIAYSRWHKCFWVGSDPAAVYIDHGLAHWTSTGAIPNWDTTLSIQDGVFVGKAAAFAVSTQTLRGDDPGPTPGGGIGLYKFGLSAGGANDWIGPANLWDILYLYAMSTANERGGDPAPPTARFASATFNRMLNVMNGNANLAGRLPWHVREADANAGTGNFFDQQRKFSITNISRTGSTVSITTAALHSFSAAGTPTITIAGTTNYNGSCVTITVTAFTITCTQAGVVTTVETSGTVTAGAMVVGTLGKVVSINARQQISFLQPTAVCDFAIGADNFVTGTVASSTIHGWTQLNLDHMPDIAYITYLFTGRNYFLEELQYEAAWVLGTNLGCYGANTLITHQGAAGFLAETEAGAELRGDAWGTRTLTYAAFVSPDGTPEEAYFDDKLRNGLARWQGEHDIVNTDAKRESYWNFGKTLNRDARGPSPLGAWSDINGQTLITTSEPVGAPIIETTANISAASRAGTTVTITTGTTPHGYRVGQPVVVTGVVPASFNTPTAVSITAVPTTISFQYTLAGADTIATSFGTANVLCAAQVTWTDNFMNVVLGVARDMGYPADDLLKFTAKRNFHWTLDAAVGPITMAAVARYPSTPAVVGQTCPADPTAQIALPWTATFAALNTWYQQPIPTTWPTPSADTPDHSYSFIHMAALSFMYPYIVDGFTGINAWNAIRTGANKQPNQSQFGSDAALCTSSGICSPKWDIVPRTGFTFTAVTVISPPPPATKDRLSGVTKLSGVTRVQ